jgi:eukaryotic-like serine/threonine-protein kinase
MSESTNEIIRMKTDGTNRTTLLNVQSDFLYVKGEWVYYTVMDTGNLFKAKIDGSNIQKLSDDYCMFVNIVGDTIYYCNVSDKRKVYKIVNNKKSKIIDSTCTFLNVVGDWIYFVNKSDDEKVYRVKTDGREKTVIINQKCGNVNVSKDWIYYTIDDNNIQRAKLNGTKQETIAVNFNTSTPCLSIFGDWIYYFSIADGSKICRIRSDGTSKTILG